MPHAHAHAHAQAQAGADEYAEHRQRQRTLHGVDEQEREQAQGMNQITVVSRPAFDHVAFFADLSVNSLAAAKETGQLALYRVGWLSVTGIWGLHTFSPRALAREALSMASAGAAGSVLLRQSRGKRPSRWRVITPGARRGTDKEQAPNARPNSNSSKTARPSCQQVNPAMAHRNAGSSSKTNIY